MNDIVTVLFQAAFYNNRELYCNITGQYTAHIRDIWSICRYIASSFELSMSISLQFILKRIASLSYFQLFKEIQVKSIKRMARGT